MKNEIREGLRVAGTARITIFRASGKVEEVGPVHNLIPDTGSEEFAKLILGEASSPPAYMIVGTDSTAVNVSDTNLPGEAARKALSTNASSLNTLVQVATFGGAADSLTGVDLVEMGTANHANSGQGQLTGRLTHASSTVTLQQSDLAKYEYVTTVGTHS